MDHCVALIRGLSVFGRARGTLAAMHGVLEEGSSSNGPLTAMIQSLNRFLLDQVSLDQRNWQPGSTALEEAINVGATKSQRCVVCGKETRSLGDTNVTDLMYLSKVREYLYYH